MQLALFDNALVGSMIISTSPYYQLIMKDRPLILHISH